MPHYKLLIALKDPYIVLLTVAAGPNNQPIEVRYGNVHFSSDDHDARARL
jgi:hypothetical protein